MLETLISFLIIMIIVCAVAWLALWVVKTYLPQVAIPAQIVIGVVVVVFLLPELLKLLPRLGL